MFDRNRSVKPAGRVAVIVQFVAQPLPVLRDMLIGSGVKRLNSIITRHSASTTTDARHQRQGAA
jgi:hypothetical protein